MAIQKISFTNKAGDQLSAKIELPVDQKPKAYVLFAHCFTCNKNLAAVRNISKSMTGEGFAVVSFDFTGLGNSEGDFSDTNFSSNIDDLIQAASFLKESYEAPQMLIGHSLGGAAVIYAASQIASVKAVVTIGAPSSPDHVQHLFAENIAEIRSKEAVKVDIGGRPFTLKRQFIEDLESKKMSEVIKSLKKPLLLMHSPQDSTVGVNNAAEIYGAAMHPKSFISLDGADHLLSNAADSLYAGSVIANWATRYLSLPEPKTLKTDHQVVTSTASEGYTTDILAGKHHMRADEPEDVGGKGFGPTPYDFLLSGLGACTGMTLRMYADRKGWPLEGVNVHLSHQKDYAKDCKDCESNNTKIDIIEREITLEGALTEEQKAKLLEIADKCPVHKTLHSEIKVKTVLGKA